MIKTGKICSLAIAFGVLMLAHVECFAQLKGQPNPTQNSVVRAPTNTPLDTPKCPGTNGLSSAEINEILTAHNAARAEEKLPPVAWDCRMAAFAQEWADKSIYGHRDNFSYGENIFVSGTSTEPVGNAVKRWMLEKANWTNESATCAPGKACVHYVQVMWRATKSVGCGINRSATGKWKSVVICNYDPASRASGPPF